MQTGGKKSEMLPDKRCFSNDPDEIATQSPPVTRCDCIAISSAEMLPHKRCFCNDPDEITTQSPLVRGNKHGLLKCCLISGVSATTLMSAHYMYIVTRQHEWRMAHCGLPALNFEIIRCSLPSLNVEAGRVRL